MTQNTPSLDQRIKVAEEQLANTILHLQLLKKATNDLTKVSPKLDSSDSQSLNIVTAITFIRESVSAVIKKAK
jgi:hypothetical protein